MESEPQREAVARRVLDYFGDCLPSTRLLCFLDDDDPPELKRQRGGAVSRGFYQPIHHNTPLYVGFADKWSGEMSKCQSLLSKGLGIAKYVVGEIIDRGRPPNIIEEEEADFDGELRP